MQKIILKQEKTHLAFLFLNWPENHGTKDYCNDHERRDDDWRNRFAFIRNFTAIRWNRSLFLKVDITIKTQQNSTDKPDQPLNKDYLEGFLIRFPGEIF